MEVHFQYTRDDWVEINTEASRAWLHGLKPLSQVERCGYVFVFGLSVLAIVGLLGYLAVGAWQEHPWYYLAGAFVLLGLPCFMVYALLWPSGGGTRRGLYHELVFRWQKEEDWVAALRKAHQRVLRKREARGEVELGHRYVLSVAPEGLTLTTTYASWEGDSTTLENRYPWVAVRTVEQCPRLVAFFFADGGLLCVPRAAFSSEEEEDHFLQTAREHQADHARRTQPVPA